MVKQAVEIKAGVKTSEFWLTLLPYALFILKESFGLDFEYEIIVDGVLGLIAFITSVVYVIGRFKLKKEAVN